MMGDGRAKGFLFMQAQAFWGVDLLTRNTYLCRQKRHQSQPAMYLDYIFFPVDFLFGALVADM